MNRVYVCLAAAVLLFSSAAFAQSAPPSADTYANSMKNNIGVNYGNSPLLVVQTHGNNSYLQFNLSTVPVGATINKATLRLFVDALVTSGSFDVYQLNTSWSESTLTFSNAPPLGVSATGSHPVAVSKLNQFVVVDITSLVQGWQSGAIANNGIALALTSTTGSFSFDSKESVFTSHQPELEIVLTGVAGPQGPAGPQGVQGTAGATGPAGSTGATGAQGVAGAIGPQGIKGDSGATGPQGTQGLTGNTGATGATGLTGATGATGAQGPLGLTGAQGSAGLNGTNGTGFNFRQAFDNSATYAAYDVVTYNGSSYDATVAIPAGGATPDMNPSWTLMAEAGTNGANGAPGSNGAQGLQGPQGIQGSTGNTGATGPQGVAGPIGPQGIKGDTGATGTQGPQGLIGNTGATGPIGPQGIKGDTGAIGPQGTQGIQGLTGNTGATGTVGPMGLPGQQGPAGNDGAAGTNGTGFNFTGLFNPSTTYNAFDVVTYQGSTYDATTSIPASTTTPDIAPGWVLMAQMGAAGTPGLPGPAGAIGPAGSNGATGATGAKGDTGAVGSQGPIGVDGATGPTGPAGPQGLQGATGDINARMIFPSFYPGNLTGTWVGGQFTLDQAITVLRIAAVAKTPTGAACPAAVFRLTNSTKGQDLVLAPGQNWSDTGAMVMTFAAGDVLQASLRTGSTCASNTGADANLLVEYKMQAAGDTDACAGTSCNGFCTTTSADSANCGACGTACTSGTPCIDGGCGLASAGGACTSAAQCSSGMCTSGVCVAGCPAGQMLCGTVCVNEATDTNNCGACGNVCASGQTCSNGACTLVCGAGLTACNGACVNLATSTSNCGNCGTVCTTNNDVAACLAGACAVQSCNPGFQDCNHNSADGCEVNTNNDARNCGACGNVCITGQSCSNGACVGGAIGATCTSSAGCASNACDLVTSKCVSSTCVDQRKDGAETDIDSGGGTCGACAVGKACLQNPDCLTTACDAVSFTCVATQCTDHQKDGAETGVDCGGGTCPACGLGQACNLDTDCTGGACDAITHACVSSQCVDHQKDGNETDIDCGGGICSACAVGKICIANTDCTSNACDGITFTCDTNQCFDHKKDGAETDVDCGGGTCSACAVGLRCSTSLDCQPGHFCNASKVCQ